MTGASWKYDAALEVERVESSTKGSLDTGSLASLDTAEPDTAGPRRSLDTSPVPRIDLAPLVGLLEDEWGADSDGQFPCPVPGHAGRARIGVLPPEEDPLGDGAPRLMCCSGRWRSLAEVYAFGRYRAAFGLAVDQKLSNIEIATWSRRLAYEAGTFSPAAVEVPPAPNGASAVVAKARDGFALLLGLRRADGLDPRVAYAVRFCAAWCGIGYQPARLALIALRSEGVIVEAGRSGRVRLYLPGSAPPPRLRVVPDPIANVDDEPSPLVLGLDAEKARPREGMFDIDPEDYR